MHIRFTAPLLLVLAFMLMACQDGGTTQQQIAVVDLERLMRDSVPGQNASKFIEKQQTAAQNQLAAIQDRLEKNPNDDAAQQELQKVYAISMQKLQNEAQNAANLIQDAIKRVLLRMQEQKGYDAIIYSETLAAYSKRADITAAVLAELNKENIEFKPLAQSAVTPAPEKAESMPAQAPAPEAGAVAPDKADTTTEQAPANK